MNLNKKEIYTKSNLLSLLRLLLGIPIFFLISHINDSAAMRYFTFVVLILTASTDAFDGYLARKYNEITEFGKIIDPLADKVVVGLIVLQLFLMKEIPTYFFIIIIIRDFLILIGGIIVTKKIGKVLPSNILGKITVIFISMYILVIIAGLKSIIPFINEFFLYTSTILVFASLIAYFVRSIESLKRN